MSNPLLQLRGSFSQKRNGATPGAPKLPAGKQVCSDEVRRLRNDLFKVKDYWDHTTHVYKPLVAVVYKRIIPKSGRVRRLLSEVGSLTANDTVVGARFMDNGKYRQHVITHCISSKALESSIDDLDKLADCLDVMCEGVVTTEKLESINSQKIDFNRCSLSRSAFSRLVVDVCHVERFTLNNPSEEIEHDSMVTLYKNTGINNTDFLRDIGVAELNLRSYDESTYLLTPDQYHLLYAAAPQLIAMALVDVNEISTDSAFVESDGEDKNRIPSPSNEPWVGVLDTPFNRDVYFSEWVDSSIEVDQNIIQQSDYIHGTCVSSIIVDGPALNPALDDGCGRFRVRHVGIAAGGKFSSFTIVREIEKAVARYPEVKVWNLSLGSMLEIPENFVSAEAAALDRIQSEHDVIFVVAGTNDGFCTGCKRIGSPADSINSLVVNSVRFDGSLCSYARKGPVLQFFGKPDVSYYGGDVDQRMSACCQPRTSRLVFGTSFAAPWVTRKMAYLIHVVGMNREVAKALIVDSACGWSQSTDPNCVGYGVVPKRIEDIVSTPEDEIKFVISGMSEMFDTYTHNIPVPVFQGRHPYIAKATLCYFPHCERSQGVDYTSTELSLSFGRLNNEKIKPIDNNNQDLTGFFTYEEEARQFFRKWDNVKHIAEKPKNRARPKKSYGNGLWGISLKTKERLEKNHGTNMRFGIVVTLRAIDGVNRIEDFIQRCSFRTWIVNRVDILSQIEFFNAVEQDIEFE